MNMRKNSPGWIEAYQVYLEKHCTKEVLEALCKNKCFDDMTDDEISDAYFEYVEGNNIYEEAKVWVLEYCKKFL